MKPAQKRRNRDDEKGDDKVHRQPPIAIFLKVIRLVPCHREHDRDKKKRQRQNDLGFHGQAYDADTFACSFPAGTTHVWRFIAETGLSDNELRRRLDLDLDGTSRHGVGGLHVVHTTAMSRL